MNFKMKCCIGNLFSYIVSHKKWRTNLHSLKCALQCISQTIWSDLEEGPNIKTYGICGSQVIGTLNENINDWQYLTKFSRRNKLIPLVNYIKNMKVLCK